MNLNKLKKAELIELVKKLEKEKESIKNILLDMTAATNQEKLDFEDKIQDLNIKCKYHLFDAEASQRELKYLKKLLKDKEE